RANTTVAEPAGAAGEYLITGHKWFCSAPMCDAFLVLAQTPKGLTCFLLPRWKPDGAKNNFFIQRLKDKMGNRSNASSEADFDRADGCYQCGIRPRRAAPRRERGAGRDPNQRKGQPPPPGLRRGLGGTDAAGAGAGRASRTPPQSLWETSDRPAIDGQRACRPG